MEKVVCKNVSSTTLYDHLVFFVAKYDSHKRIRSRSKETRLYRTLAITDKNVLSGAAEFYRICMSEKIQPIIGLNLTYQFQERHYELLLYAKDRIGYQQLIKLSSKKMIREKIEASRVSMNSIICLSFYQPKNRLLMTTVCQHHLIAIGKVCKKK